jgi:hypothetical protein
MTEQSDDFQLLWLDLLEKLSYTKDKEIVCRKGG